VTGPDGTAPELTFGNGALKVFRSGDGVTHVLIDRPPVNAMDEAAYLGLRDCFEELAFDAPTRAIVLSAAGDRAFVAGTDVRDFGNQHQDDPAWAGRHARKAHSAFHTIFRCTKPVIAAVRAATLGSGIGIVASCDAVLAAPGATFGLPEINVGVLGGANFLMRLVSPQQARIMQYTGRRLTAVEMAPYGAVQLVEDTSPEEAALALAAEIAAKSPAAIKLAKEGFNHLELGRLSLFEGYTYEQGLTERLSTTKEANEASSAFLAGRSS
jgi:enoyl-CoA hydratase/carnithine racemase